MRRIWITICLVIFSLAFSRPVDTLAQSSNPNPPEEPVKLIFIHHSTGENWLTDGNGDLGRVLAENNYFVSDTNYGWGPDSIGDRTDYYDWVDWFVGQNSDRYLDALYIESGQNSSYTRSIADPGGENQIVMFKSCFPNSNLAGNPGDPPADSDLFTVGHAKFVYNQLLSYFATRPDKLFVVITAPPLIDSTYAENARAFSRWLVEDWLAENEYHLNNVAVWDFHNILTHPDNHHRFQSGSIEYTIQNGNGTLYYDSDGDDHPNGSGNQKATAEFVPMLNVFYNRWKAEAPESPTPSMEETTQPESDEIQTEEPEEPPKPELFGATDIIDDFEAGSPTGTNGWESFWDDSTRSTLSCGADNSLSNTGTNSLRIDFQIKPDGWGTCSLFYDETIPGLASFRGLSFYYHASAPGLIFNLDVHGGTPEARATYFYTIETVPESVDGWVYVDLTWDQILRVDWEENPRTPVIPAEINGFAFGFNTYENTPNSGTIWIDELQLITEETAKPVIQPTQEEEPEITEVQTEETTEGRCLCGGSMAMVAMALIFGIFHQKQRQR